MIVTDRFVFLHLHKSGGTFVNECLLRFVGGAHRVGYHLPRAMIPARYAALPALGMVRSPWSYYVSWYAFQSQQQQGNALFRVASADRTLDFRGTIGNLLELGGNDHRLDALVRQLPGTYTGGGLNVPGPVIERIRGSNLGFYSFLHDHIYGGPGALHVGRLEHLRADLLRLLAAVSQPVSAEMRSYIESAGSRNSSAHDHYTDYYDDSLRTRVAQRDALVIEKYGYRFGD